MIQLIWLTIALPLLGVLVNGIFGRRLGQRAVSIIAPLMVLLAFLIGAGARIESDGHPVTVELWTWATIGDFSVPVNLLVDPLSLLMVLVVTGVGFLIHVYATAYMVHQGEDGRAHYDRDLHPLFHLPEPVHRLNAGTGAGRQLPVDVCWLGIGWGLILPANWFLV
jgi:formate hydrogenlyase subunit 3/multisubunit Na+/H+ antiporter MnhD subunit